MKLAHQALRLGRFLYINDNLESHMLVPWHEELPRERRIRDRERMQNKARAICRINHAWVRAERPSQYQTIETREVMFFDTPKRCSCWMCGNQRRIEGAPIRERRQLEGEDHERF